MSKSHTDIQPDTAWKLALHSGDILLLLNFHLMAAKSVSTVLSASLLLTDCVIGVPMLRRCLGLGSIIVYWTINIYDLKVSIVVH